MARPIPARALLAALKREGVKVKPVRAWRRHNRNRRGAWGPVHGVLIHHTVTHGAEQTVGLVRRGRPDLPGPLAHAVITKNGTVHLVGHGRANHAGTGDPDVLDAVIHELPLPTPNANSADGNAWFYGFECENLGNGKDSWPEPQLDAIERAAAAICRHHDWGAPSVIGHLEWTNQKSDPRGFSMDRMRERIAERLKHPPDDQPRKKPPKRKPKRPKPPAPAPTPPPRKDNDPMTEAARRTVRTMVQTALSLAAALPVLLEAADIPRTAAGVTTALAVAGAVTRIMQTRQAQKLLPKWLRTAIPDPDDIPEPEPEPARGGGAV